MKTYEAKDLRNVGFVGHGDSGKTSLVSAVLFDTDMVNRLGCVDDGTATTDFDAEEIDDVHVPPSSVIVFGWPMKIEWIMASLCITVSV